MIIADPKDRINHNQFRYYPSLSSGAAQSWLKKNVQLAPGITSRFYDESFPSKFYHPYFLTTAGHHYKKKDWSKQYGFEKVQILGDSGGFQLATGRIKWEPKFKVDIFNWLEDNADIAMNLDLPPRVTLQGQFNECLDISLDNFKYFEEHQSGKTKYLTVLQGDDEQQFDIWYNKVNHFQFNGWALGNCRKVNHLFLVLAKFLMNGEFEKPNFQYLHILGASKLYDFFLYEYLQACINEYTNSNIQVSTDSSSPGLNSVYGNEYIVPDYRSGDFLSIYKPKGTNPDYHLKMDAPLPCLIDCPACKDKLWKDIAAYKTDTYMRIVTHNMCVFIKTINDIKLLTLSHHELLKDIVSPNMYQILSAMKEMFVADNPMAVYEKYKPVFDVFNASNNLQTLGYSKSGDPAAKIGAAESFFQFN